MCGGTSLVGFWIDNYLLTLLTCLVAVTSVTVSGFVPVLDVYVSGLVVLLFVLELLVVLDCERTGSASGGGGVCGVVYAGASKASECECTLARATVGISTGVAAGSSHVVGHCVEETEDTSEIAVRVDSPIDDLACAESLTWCKED